MSGAGTLVVQTARDGEGPTLTELVMAWARDSDTGEPRYILELGPERRGSRCGCECPSCGLALTAVNAAKEQFIRRPHFRHPEGAPRDACLVLAARAAAMRQLQDDGWIALPRRRMSAGAAGLSGHNYEAWVERPAERIRIRDVDYRDRAVAVVTFDDGRLLRVVLTGTAGGEKGVVDERGLPVPTILIDVDDPSLAAMAPDELRHRLKLLPDGLCWRGHWNDAELAAQATAMAKAEAHFYFDDLPDGIDLPDGLDPSLRRETVLHHEVKRILAQERRLKVPGVDVNVELPTVDGGTLRAQWLAGFCDLELDFVELEQRLGLLIPDITCKAWSTEGGVDWWPFFIEVTVTNPINDERLARIREVREATLEIDLSLAGGRVTRAELPKLVIDELATKRWLYHPEAEQQRAAMHAALTQQAEEELAQGQARAQAIAERRQRVQAAPIADLAVEYLDAVFALVEVGAEEGPDRRQPSTAKVAEHAARERVADMADKLAIRGYPEAADENLIGYHGILSRILSVQLDRPVGYGVENLMGVLNAIRQLSWPNSSTVSLYFIAMRAYRPKLTERQEAWFEAWVSEVRVSLKRGEKTYRRDPAYDHLLSVLFPEMAAGLAQSGAKRQPEQAIIESHPRTDYRQMLPPRRRARFIEGQPAVHAARAPLLDTQPGDWWLKGRDLAAWKRANPEQARAWFGDDGRDAT